MNSSPQPVPLYRFLAPSYWPVWLGLGVARVLSLLPYRAGLAIGASLGGVLRRLLTGRRRVAARNIAVCLPELSADERHDLLVRHFRSLGMAVTETALSWWAPDEKLEPLCEVDGLHHLEKALEGGRGAILLSAHFTTLEIGARLLSMATKLHVMYRRHENPLFEEIMRRNRARRAEKAIRRQDVRGMLRSLKSGRPVWYAPDQSRAGKYASLVPFFDVPAVTNTATTRIARMSRAPVLPFFPERLPDGRGYRIVIGAPLDEYPTDDAEADALRFNRLIEQRVRARPEQYYWVHRRFKGRGPDLPDVYADEYDAVSAAQSSGS